MAATQKARATTHSKNADFGLVAIGSSGPWEISIDEAASGANRWWAQIEGPSVSLYFAIPAPSIVDTISRFLGSRLPPVNHPSNGVLKESESLVIGKDKRIPVGLLRDDEYGDRFFLVVGPTEGPIIRFTIAGSDLTNLAKALQQVKEDLDDQD